MLWLDSVLSLPAIGIGFEGKIAQYLRMREVLLPFLEERFKLRQVHFPSNSPIETLFTLDNGFRIKVEQQRLFVDFVYDLPGDDEPGKLPQPHSPEIQAYSKLFEDAASIFLPICMELFSTLQGMKITFLGIVARSYLPLGEIPPGLSRFCDHLRKPWPLGLWNGEGDLVATLLKEEAWFHRCHHRFAAPFHKAHGEMGFTFDYQEVLTPSQVFSAGLYQESLGRLRTSALAYFERFAEGDLAYD